MSNLEKMADFFASRVDSYDEHMLSKVEGCREGYEKMALFVPKTAKRLLDLGCGTGLELDEILKLMPDIEITGVDLTQEMLDAAYHEFYDKEEFVRVRSKDSLPCTKLVQGSNYCDVAPVWDARTKRIVVVSCIDNLVKGASGQAVQNMNLMMGLDEGMGLRYGVMYP